MMLVESVGFVSLKKLMKSLKVNLVLSRLILLAIFSGRFWLINHFFNILTPAASRVNLRGSIDFVHGEP